MSGLALGSKNDLDEDRRLMINYFLERTSGQLTSTGAASKRTVGPSRSLIVQNWRKIVLELHRLSLRWLHDIALATGAVQLLDARNDHRSLVAIVMAGFSCTAWAL